MHDGSPPPLPRDQFPVTAHHIFLNHAGVAPLPQAAVDAITRCSVDYAERGSLAYEDWDVVCEDVRSLSAQLMGVDRDEVAFVKNTTEGLGFVANGLDWSPGDRVLLPAGEFPSTAYPWLSLRDRGVVVDLIEPEGPTGALPLERFADALAARPTRLVAISWVQFRTGWRTDLAALAELCHQHGALLCADVIQGLGALPADLAAWGVDFAMADAHKWLLGPQGIGVLYVPRRHQQTLRPLEPGWASVVHREEWDNPELVYDDNARRYEGGTPNQASIAAMGAAMRLLADAGVDRVAEHLDLLGDHLVAGLGALGERVELCSDRGAHRSGIVTFRVEGEDAVELKDHLLEAGIVTSPRAGGIRVAPHGYTTTDEIDAVVDAVADRVRGR